VIRDTSSRSSTKAHQLRDLPFRRSRWRRTASPCRWPWRRDSSAIADRRQRVAEFGFCRQPSRGTRLPPVGSRARVGPGQFLPVRSFTFRSNIGARAALSDDGDTGWRGRAGQASARPSPGIVGPGVPAPPRPVREWPCPVNRMTGRSARGSASSRKQVDAGLGPEPVIDQENVVPAGADRLGRRRRTPASSRGESPAGMSRGFAGEKKCPESSSIKGRRTSADCGSTKALFCHSRPDRRSGSRPGPPCRSRCR